MQHHYWLSERAAGAVADTELQWWAPIISKASCLLGLPDPGRIPSFTWCLNIATVMLCPVLNP